MASIEIRNQANDSLLTPKNSALLIIDYQPAQINAVNSMPRSKMLNNIVVAAMAAEAYGLPIILSTVNVAKGSGDTVPTIKNAIGTTKSHDRTSINAWEDREFRNAVIKTARRKLLVCALWTESGMSFPTLDMLGEGYEVYPVVDALGGTSIAAHEAALRRVEMAGARPTSVAQLLCELQRDWNRRETVPDAMRLLYSADIFLNMGG